MYLANVPELEARFPAELLDVMLHVQIPIEKCPNVSDNIRRHNMRDAHLEVQDREFWAHVRGTHQQSLRLWVVELEPVLDHPRPKVCDTCVNLAHCWVRVRFRCWAKCDIDLSVVCIKMQLEAMHTSDIAERSRVRYENKWSQHRALGNTEPKLGLTWWPARQVNTLLAVR